MSGEGLQRVCPHWRCAALNPPTATRCCECGGLLVMRAIGDLSRPPCPPLDDNDDWDRRKRLEEEEARRHRA